MVSTDLTEAESDIEIRQRRTLEDLKRRLLSLAASLDPLTADAATLRRTADELDGMVCRLHWLADISTHAD